MWNLVKQGKYDLAIKSYQKAIAINPDHASAHNNLGLVYVKQGKLDEAIAECKKALEINPNYLQAHYNIACAYSLKKEKTLAIESLQKATTLDSRVIEASKTNSDFDNIRESREFQQLINSIK